jgi:hypothetical protein
MFRDQVISLLQMMIPLPTNAPNLTRNTLGRRPVKALKAEVIYLMEHETSEDVARWLCR